MKTHISSKILFSNHCHVWGQMIKVAIAIQNAVKIIPDFDKILILLENLVFARGEIIF